MAVAPPAASHRASHAGPRMADLAAPARLVFGDALVNGSLPPANGWPALALSPRCCGRKLCGGAGDPRDTRRADRALAAPDAHESGVAAGAPDDRRPAAARAGARSDGCARLTLVLLPSLPSDDVSATSSMSHQCRASRQPLVTAPSAFPHDPFLTLVFCRAPARCMSAWATALRAVTGLRRRSRRARHLCAALQAARLGRTWQRRADLGHLGASHQTGAAGHAALRWIRCACWFCPARTRRRHADRALLACTGSRAAGRSRRSSPSALDLHQVRLAGAAALYFLLLVRARLRQGESAGAIAARSPGGGVVGRCALTALPYWAGPATLSASSTRRGTAARQLAARSVSCATRAAQGLGLAPAAAKSAVETLLKLGTLALLPGLAACRPPRGRPAKPARQLGWVLVAYVVIASGWFWPVRHWRSRSRALAGQRADDRRAAAAAASSRYTRSCRCTRRRSMGCAPGCLGRRLATALPAARAVARWLRSRACGALEWRSE